MKQWYYLYSEGDGHTHMNVDAALLKSSIDVPVLRLYRFIPSCITVGYHQKDFTAYNNIPVVQRITGGRAVYHDTELTYSITSPISFFHNSIYGSYREIAAALINALRYFSSAVQCERSAHHLSLKNDSCFSSISYYEIEAADRKVVGSAQRRKKDRFLQHGSILIDIDYEKQSEIFDIPVDILKQQMIGLSEVADKNLDIDELKEKIVNSFEKTFNITFQKLTVCELEKLLVSR